MNSHSQSSKEMLALDVDGDVFAIDINSVQEIRVLEGIRKLPDPPKGWLGVIDFREQIVPVIDLRVVFKASDTSIGSKTVVVVVQTDKPKAGGLTGIVVDAVADVIPVDLNAVKQSPDSVNEESSIIQGLFKHEGSIVVMLDVKKLAETKNIDRVHEQISEVGRSSTL